AAVLGAASLAQAGTADATVARGKYLVTVAGCNDCHTPLKMGPNGPAPDLTRMLSGHPQDLAMPPAPPMSGPWGVAMALTATAFSGPWGTTFASNLTPDPETGIGRWTEKDFVDTVRSGRHLGRGRPILPPMPIAYLRQMTDEDLKAVYAYLRSVPAVQNRVPEYRAPAVASAK
ncbi:MAG TPA: c-type cytochrome, partial [Anaeromyxobacteraceae bacterium]|nr:c-type cytochrome [Anaeromyxobacteraceae bacterium]